MGTSGIIFRDLDLVRIDLDLVYGLFIMAGPAWMFLSVVAVGMLDMF